MSSNGNRLFPRSGCPFPIPNPRAERYKPFFEKGKWALITGFFEVGDLYGVLRESGTSEHILFHTVGGEGFIVTEDGWASAPPGHTIVIEPGTPHYYATHPQAEHWHFHWVHYFPPPQWTSIREIPERLPGLRVANIPSRHRGRAEVPRALREAHEIRQQSLPNATSLAMNALERALLWMGASGKRDKAVDPRIRKATDHILAHPEQSHPVEELARRAGLSNSRFAHLFREQTGHSPQKFVESLRLDLAREWLRAGGRSVSEIADALGFSSPFYFSRRFKARHGRSPTQETPRESIKS